MSRPPHPPRLPRAPAALLRSLLPPAERDEVMDEVAREYAERAEADGEAAARRWLWAQVTGSAPALARRSWWRGWSGFEAGSETLRTGGGAVENWARDVRFGLRRLRTRPLYAGLVVFTLALGVAGTAAVFGITRKLLLEPLPFPDEEQVAVFWFGGAWSEEEFLSLRPDMTGFEHVAAYRHADATLVVRDAPARLIRAYSVTGEFFDVLGVEAALGPGLQSGDDVLGAEPVAILSYGLWEELGADSDVIGSRLDLAGEMRTVAGVMPQGFWYPDPRAQMWLAEALDPNDGVGNYTLIGRMQDGATLAGMDTHLDRIVTLLGERFEFPEGWDLTKDPELTPVRDELVGSMRPSLLAALGAMVAILLTACVNVAALMLGQVDSRATELAVRDALGAGGARLVRQLVVEALVMGLLAGIVGAILAVAGFRLLVTALPLGELAETATVDWSLFATALGFALVAATAVSLAPALSVARSDLQTRLSRSRTAGIGGRGGRLEGALVVAQVALVLLIVSGAALLIRSVGNLRDIETGVDTDGLAVVDVVLPAGTPGPQSALLAAQMIEAVSTVPGVRQAAATERLPLRGSSNNWGIAVENRPEARNTSTAFRPVSPGYFETMGIQVVRGRGLEESDRDASAPEGAVVINQALADQYFPGVDPLGRRIAFSDRWDRVVGVVENVAESELSPNPVPSRYYVFEQVPWLLPMKTVVLRTNPGVDPQAVLAAARSAIQTAAPSVAILTTTTMTEELDLAIGPALQVMSLLSLLGAVALILGVVGVYGVVSHFVHRRRRDWGIRMALGARPSRIVAQIVGRGAALVGTGVAVGVVAFLLLARLLSSLLYGIEPVDGPSLVAGVVVLVIAGLAAALIPAQRGSRIDPARVLREQ